VYFRFVHHLRAPGNQVVNDDPVFQEEETVSQTVLVGEVRAYRIFGTEPHQRLVNYDSSAVSECLCKNLYYVVESTGYVCSGDSLLFEVVVYYVPDGASHSFQCVVEASFYCHMEECDEGCPQEWLDRLLSKLASDLNTGVVTIVADGWDEPGLAFA